MLTGERVLKRLLNKMSTFVQRISPVTGRQEWVMQDINYDYNQEIARAAYADMLHDTERNKKYELALAAAIKKVHSEGQEARVLDIGTGTGLLSMMAVRHNADVVTACEAFTPMYNCAKQVISDNGLTDRINLVPKHSNKLTVGPVWSPSTSHVFMRYFTDGGDMPKRANILVTEVFDTELIGEGALPTFHHAHKHLLEENCVVVPSLANLYIQVVHCDKASKWSRFQPITLPNGADVRPPSKLKKCSGTISVHDLQMELIPQDWFTPITEPVKVFRFDFSGKSPVHFKEHDIKEMKAKVSGQCDAVFMWWDLQMDTLGDIMLSCAPSWAHPDPKHIQWRDHWMQAVYYPQHQLHVEKGDSFVLHSCHDEYSLWFDVASANNSSILSAPDSPTCTCGGHVACSWTRLGMLNDNERNNRYIECLKQVITNETVCLSISDGSLLPLIAAKLGAKKVYTLEVQPMCKSMIGLYLEENNLLDKVTVINKGAEQLTPEDFDNQKVNLVIGEPHFCTTLLPWHNLLFWYSRTEVQEVLVDKPTVLPWITSIKAIVVDFDHLWKIHAPVGNCEGFNLSHFDKVIETASDLTDAYLEPQPLWEYPGKPISDQFDILHLDFSRPLNTIKVIEREGFLPLCTSGTCNGVAVWMDFHLDNTNTIATGLVKPPMIGQNLQWDIHTKQAVHLFKKPIRIEEGESQNWRLKHRVVFKPKSGELDFKFELVQMKQES
ncbi:hypothetical protein LSH36_1457g00024 [Paralvinella palmiformis]|uniref:Protein arginine N-methyltransferase n=1 Tax=Paralvinella palmiformis TaxID=53620 RepID=A0AAD9IT82_9ANNE|nr:hypothetical protein LSH36_1457g00024 [Paralvinella palmiformis]